MEIVLITGGSGLIGQRLSELLMKKNYSIRHLSRSVSGSEKYPTFLWNIKTGELDKKALENVDHIIHLAGEGVADGRWTEARKKSILSSRTESIQLLKNHLKTQEIKTFISASGISYYGTSTTENNYVETDSAGHDFLATISIAWEKKAFEMSANAARVVALRTGIVLSENGGALERLKKPIKMGIGSALGSGKQYMPWIHIEDLCHLYIAAIENKELKGIYNAVSTQHTTNLEMTQAVAKVLGKKLWAPKVPAFILKLLFGEMSEMILKGSRVDNTKIKTTGFNFQYDNLNTALTQLLLNP